MARYTVTIETAMSPADAFDYMADLANFEAWDPGVSSAKQIEGDGPGLDAAYAVRASGANLVYRTKEFRPPEETFVVARTTFFTSLDRITVAAKGTGSLVTYDAELKLNGPLVLADPVLGLAFNRIGDKAAAGLERVLEGTRR